MKVIQINAVNRYSSTGRSTYELNEFLNKAGVESYVAFSVGKNDEKNFRIGNKFIEQLHALSSRIFGVQGYGSFFSTKKLLKIISKINPDIIHLRNLHSNYINLNLLFKYIIKRQIVTVITLHDCWFYTGKCTHYFLDKCYRWQYQCGNCPRLKKDIPSWFFDRTKKMLSDKKKWFSKIDNLATVGVSDWITNEARKSILASSKIITRIYNWIDRSIFKPTDYNIEKERLKIENKFVILGVASGWSKSKGLFDFFELAQKLNDEYIIVLVGKMPEKLDIPKRVMSISRTENLKELAMYYSMADVFLNFSFQESFGKVVVEALACGTPVISIDSTANSELIKENCGYLVKQENYKEEIIKKIKLVKDKGKTFYTNYCIEYSRNFDFEERAQETLNLYKEMIKKRKNDK